MWRREVCADRIGHPEGGSADVVPRLVGGLDGAAGHHLASLQSRTSGGWLLEGRQYDLKEVRITRNSVAFNNGPWY